MIQLISHLFGDFVFQNDWMASNKGVQNKKGYISCFVHCLVYTIFFYSQATFLQLMLIFLSHFLIDKFRLAFLWCNYFKVGARLEQGNWLKIYLIFMVDTAFHLACNYIILTYI